MCVIIDRRLTIRLLLTQWRCCVFLQFLRLLGSLFSCHWVSDKASHDGGRKKRVSTDDLYGVTNTKSQYNHLQMLHRTPSTRAHWPYLQERLPCWVCNQTVKRNASYFASHWPYQSLRKTVAEISCARKQFRAAELLFFFSSVELFSGQDEVRTSNLLHRSWDFLHSGLMLQQLSHLADWKSINL